MHLAFESNLPNHFARLNEVLANVRATYKAEEQKRDENLKKNEQELNSEYVDVCQGFEFNFNKMREDPEYHEQFILQVRELSARSYDYNEKYVALFRKYMEDVKNSGEEYLRKVKEISNKKIAILQQETVRKTEVVKSSSVPITYITVKYNAGYGNSLSMCGTGPNMSWEADKALLLRCVGDDTWVYETSSSFEPFHFKILLNGKVWEEGDDHIVSKDKPVEIVPRFS